MHQNPTTVCLQCAPKSANITTKQARQTCTVVVDGNSVVAQCDEWLDCKEQSPVG
eukprot:m.231168 g.231168  ORF g.231168 m.231168 type:complete len:55 (+) comp19265_c0_seq2:1121-1285(+)